MIPRSNVEDNQNKATTSDESRVGNVVPLRRFRPTAQGNLSVEISDISQDSNSKEPGPPAA